MSDNFKQSFSCDQLQVTERRFKNSPRLSEYSVQLNESELLRASFVPFMYDPFKVELFVIGIRIHFCLKWPMNNCNPMRANTLKQKTVRIITSASFFTDWNNAPTMVFRPARYSSTCYTKKSIKHTYITHKQREAFGMPRNSPLKYQCNKYKKPIIQNM